MQSGHKQTGFTIVELLIVIVVIAILAAITIVAYNGIQNRAKDSAVNTAASQAGKKLLAYAPTNTDRYPTEANFADATFRSTTLSLPADTTTANYDYYASDDQKSFCLSVTNTTTDPLTAYAMTQSGQVVQGRCVKNLLPNPSFTVDLTGWSQYQSTRNRISGGPQGDGSLSIQRTAAATDGMAAQNPGASSIRPNTTYTFSVWAWADAPRTLLSYTGIQENGTPWRMLAARVSQTVTTTPTRYSVTGTTPADTIANTRVTLRPPNVDAGISYFDGVMITEGATLYAYGDGESPNWSWTGVRYNSTSFGPALPN